MNYLCDANYSTFARLEWCSLKRDDERLGWRKRRSESDRNDGICWHGSQTETIAYFGIGMRINETESHS